MGNMGKIIHDIYETAFAMFQDMPQGDHKKRAKYRFASKTLMRILPSPQKELINDLIDKKEISMNLKYQRLRRPRRAKMKVNLKRRRKKQNQKRQKPNYFKFIQQRKTRKSEIT